jgi:putative sterol carrier protein
LAENQQQPKSTEPTTGQRPSLGEITLINLAKGFRREAAADLTAVYQLRLTGDGGGVWQLSIADQQCAVLPGPAERPDVTITMAAGDWVDLLSGRLDGYNAFFQGRIRVEGDLSLALRLQGLFEF